MRISRIAALVAAFAMLVVAALPASAQATDEQDAGTFTGSANIGSAWLDPNVTACEQDGLTAVDPGSDGMRLPEVDDIIDPDSDPFEYKFQITTELSGLRLGEGVFSVCGELTAFQGIGAACLWGQSKEDTVLGAAEFATAGMSYEFDSLEFLALGGSVPVTGRYSSSNGEIGTAIAIVQAADGEPPPGGCFSQDGVRSFDAVGVFAFVRD